MIVILLDAQKYAARCQRLFEMVIHNRNRDHEINTLHISDLYFHSLETVSERLILVGMTTFAQFRLETTRALFLQKTLAGGVRYCSLHFVH